MLSRISTVKRLIIEHKLIIIRTTTKICLKNGSENINDIKIITIRYAPKYFPTGSYTGFLRPDVPINRMNMRIINTRINGSYQPVLTNAKKQEIIRIKSAVTSRYAPLLDVEPVFLAINPSKMSVIPAKTNIPNEIKIKPFTKV